MELKDDKRICMINGCTNLGEWSKTVGNKLYRRRLCSNHRAKLVKKNNDTRTYAKERFKEFNCKLCEYCGWEGPCDVHRPNIGRYTRNNMRSACPNCHRLISMGLIKDKFIDTDKLVC